MTPSFAHQVAAQSSTLQVQTQPVEAVLQAQAVAEPVVVEELLVVSFRNTFYSSSCC